MKGNQLQPKQTVNHRLSSRVHSLCLGVGAALAFGLMPPAVCAQSVDEQDADGDGLSNLMEYALGTDASDATDANAALRIYMIRLGDTRYLAMDYMRRTDANILHLQYLPEVSGDKQVWYADLAHVLKTTVANVGGGFEKVTVTDMTPLSDSASRFMRLRVNQSQPLNYQWFRERAPQRLLVQVTTTSPVFVGGASIIKGNGGSGSKLTLFSQRMTGPLAHAGKVTSVQATQLVDAKAKWLDGEFGTNGLPAYVEFANGRMVDVCHCVAGSKTLCLACNLSDVASAGSAYQLRSHLTISSLFGAHNEVGLKSGESAAQADYILLQIPETQVTRTIFYYSNHIYHGWVDGNLSPADNCVVYPQQAVMVVRSAPGDRQVYFAGPTKTGPTVVSVEPGYNLLGTLKPTSVALGTLNLYTGDPATGFISGPTASRSDNLLMVAPDGTTTTFFYYSTPGVYEGWVDGGLNAAEDVLIAPGSVLVIKRLTGEGPFEWTIPPD